MRVRNCILEKNIIKENIKSIFYNNFQNIEKVLRILFFIRKMINSRGFYIPEDFKGVIYQKELKYKTIKYNMTDKSKKIP